MNFYMAIFLHLSSVKYSKYLLLMLCHTSDKKMPLNCSDPKVGLITEGKEQKAIEHYKDRLIYFMKYVYQELTGW